MAERETDESTFDALGNDDGAVLGPAAVLLIGFEQAEGVRLGGLLRQTGAAEHRVVCCTTTMGALTVAQALAGDDGGTLLPVGKVPRVVLLSGLSDARVGAVLDRYHETGLPRPIFAVATEANLGVTVIQLLEDLVAERQAMGD